MATINYLYLVYFIDQLVTSCLFHQFSYIFLIDLFFLCFCLPSAAMNAQTREEVAIKKIGNAFDNRVDAKRTLREIKLLRHMDHENVFLFFLVFMDTILGPK